VNVAAAVFRVGADVTMNSSSAHFIVSGWKSCRRCRLLCGHFGCRLYRLLGCHFGRGGGGGGARNGPATAGSDRNVCASVELLLSWSTAQAAFSIVFTTPIITAVPHRSDDAMIASESDGQFELDVEKPRPIRLQQHPLGLRILEAVGVAGNVPDLERDEARLHRLGLVVQTADGELEPSGVVGRHLGLRLDQISFQVSSDNGSSSVFASIDVVSRILRERISANTAILQSGASAIDLIVVVIWRR